MANNAKLALLRAKIDCQIQDLFVKTSFDHVVDSTGTPLSTVFNRYLTEDQVTERINNLNGNLSGRIDLKADKADLGTLASKNEVTEAELGEALKTLINSKAAQADLEALQQTVDNLGALGSKDKIEFSDLAEALQTLINSKADATALQAEVERATAAEEANAAAIKAISDDYLKAADKTELSNAIAAEKERAEGVEAGLQTQINTIMNNPDAEGAINSINEFTQYVTEHGEIAEGFRTSIAALQNKVDTGDQTVSAYVAAAIAALSIGDYAKAADLLALAGRVEALETTANGLGALATKDIVSEAELDEALKAKVNASAEANHSHENKTVLDGSTAEHVASWANIATNTQAITDLTDYVGKISSVKDIVSEVTVQCTNGMASIAFNEPIIVGETYDVMFGGEHYSIVAAPDPNNTGAIMLYVGGDSLNDNLVAIVCDNVDPATGSVVLFNNADASIDYTLHITKTTTDTDNTVVEYIDVKTDANAKAITDLTDYVGEIPEATPVVDETIHFDGSTSNQAFSITMNEALVNEAEYVVEVNGYSQKIVAGATSGSTIGLYVKDDTDARIAVIQCVFDGTNPTIRMTTEAPAGDYHFVVYKSGTVVADTVVEYIDGKFDTLGALAKKDVVGYDDLDNTLKEEHDLLLTHDEAIAALNIKANVYESTPSVDDIAEGQMFIELV